MSAVEIFIDRVPLTEEQQEERNAEKRENYPDEELYDEVLYLVDINLYLDPTVPLDILGPVTKAIGVELRERPVVEDPSDTNTGATYSILVMAVDFHGPHGLTDDYIKTRAHIFAMQSIMPFEEDNSDETITYPYQADKFVLYLARDATNTEPIFYEQPSLEERPSFIQALPINEEIGFDEAFLSEDQSEAYRQSYRDTL